MKVKQIILYLLIIMLLISTAVSCAPKDDTLTSDLGVSRSNIVETDGWAYYSTVDGVFKIRPDGTDKTLVLDTYPLLWMIYEDRIYYIPFIENDTASIPSNEDDERNTFSIYSCKIDGSDARFICDTPPALSSNWRIKLNINDGWIYIGLTRDYDYYTNFDLYRMTVDGKDMAIINQPEEIFIDYSIDDDGWIYYVTDGEFEGRLGGQLWRMQHDGTSRQQVMQQVSFTIDYNETEIFYISFNESVIHGDIYAASRFGSEKRKVLECKAHYSFFKVVGDWIYYVSYVDDPGIYKVKTDGSDHIKIVSLSSEPRFSTTTLVDNWITYVSEDAKFLEMIRISDKYETDDLLDQIRTEVWEAQIRELSERNTDDLIEQKIVDSYIDRYEYFEVRKYE